MNNNKGNDKKTNLWGRLREKVEGSGDGDGGIWQKLAEKLEFTSQKPIQTEDVVEQGLTSSRQGEYYIIKSLRDIRYLKLSDKDHFIWSLMDGTRSVADLVMDFFTKYGVFAYERVGGLVTELKEELFLSRRPSHLMEKIKERLERGTLLYHAKKWSSVFFNKEVDVKGIDGIISRMYKNFAWLFFTKPANILYVLTILLGIFFFIQILRSGQCNLFSTAGSYSLGALTFVLINLLSITIHEGAHAFATKSFGRDVPRGGFILYFGMPCFFAETSDIWLEGKSRRIIVSWAGPYSNLILAAICTIIVKAFPSFYLSDLLIKVAFLNFMSFFFNLNPLLELDGYFMLMDWLEIPFLRVKSLNFIRRSLLKKLRAREKLSSEEKIFTVFGILAGVWTIIAVIMSLFFLRWRLIRLFNDIFVSGSLTQKIVSGIVIAVLMLPIFLSLLAIVYLSLRKAFLFIIRLKIWEKTINVVLFIGLLFAVFITLPPLLFREHIAVYSMILGPVLLTASIVIFLKTYGKTRPSRVGREFITLILFALFCLSRELFKIYFNHTYFELIFSILSGLGLVLFTGYLINYLRSRFVIPWLAVYVSGVLFFGACLTSSHAVTPITRLPDYLITLLFMFSFASLLYGGVINIIIVKRLSFDFLDVQHPSGIIGDVGKLKGVCLFLFNFIRGYSSSWLGRRAVSKAERKFNEHSERSGWRMNIDSSGILQDPSESPGIIEIGRRYGEAIEYFSGLISLISGPGFVERLCVSLYDQLNWEEREVADQYLFKHISHFKGVLRPEKDIELDVGEFLRTIPLFYELSDEEVSNLSSLLKLESFKMNDKVVTQGEKGDKFYIIEEGVARVVIKDELGGESEVAELRKGDYFGEVALLKDIPRTATVIASSADLELFSLARGDFDRLVKRHFDILGKMEAGKVYVGLLKKMPLFSEFSIAQLHFLASKLKLLSFSPGDRVITVGEVGDAFYVVKNGTLEVVREEDGEAKRISVLHSGEYFGEIALLKKVPRTATIIAGDDVELLQLLADDFHKILGKYLYSSKDLEMTSSRRMHDTKNR